MKLKIGIVLIFFLNAGCAFHTEPQNNLEFHQISQLSELAGVYKNIGDPDGSISGILWPDIKQIISTNIDHKDIEYIEVIPEDNSLIVKAISNSCAIYERTYIFGQDFKIKDGKIIIHKEAHILTRGDDDVILGPSYEEITLGIDTGKHGKSRRSGYGAGLVLMLFPIAVSDTSDIRYERISDRPQEFNSCNDR